ncbi:MFS transporter [Neobacillus cucumis]|uniref:MFS transporter n=1 Tax=Neobacillus cucumis TaxID=1740721 RepID=UPI001963A7CF|nr:MFS transporter [Neobacillus cucumis]MBM7652739.1 FHS family glucose/mannose:H+ symporter-like MFS transporter [Neobacillus cucumis]
MSRFLWASYGMYFLGGITSVFFGAIMPELLSYYHTSYTFGGLLILLQSLGFIIGVPITASFMKRYHYRLILTGAALAVVVAQTGILFLPKFYLLGFLVVVNGIGASSLETAVASYVMELFKGRQAIFMSRLEVAFGAGALIMPLLASILIAGHLWRFSPLLIALFALTLAIVWQFVSISLQTSEEEGPMDAGSAAAPIFKGRIPKYSILMLFLFIIFIYVGIEGSINSFLPSIFSKNLNSSPYFASLSTSVFWIAMLCGRLVIGLIVRRVSYERYLLGSIVVGLVFIFLLTQNKTLGTSYLTVFGLGLGMSAIYSITMVYANHTFPGMERTVTSAITAFAGIGGAMFPFVIGYAMDRYLPSQVLWIIFIFSLVLLVFFLIIYISLRIIRNQLNASGL